MSKYIEIGGDILHILTNQIACGVTLVIVVRPRKFTIWIQLIGDVVRLPSPLRFLFERFVQGHCKNTV